MEIIASTNPITTVAQGHRLVYEISREMMNMRPAARKKAKGRIEKIEREIKLLMSTEKPRIEELDELIQGEGCEQKCNEYRDEQLSLIRDWLIEYNIQNIIELVTSGEIETLRAWLEPVFEDDYASLDEDSLYARYRSMRS